MGRAFVRGLNDGPSNIEVEYEPPCDGLREHFSRTDNCGKLERWQRLTELMCSAKRSFKRKSRSAGMLSSQSVCRPLPGCDCTYEMYGYRSASLADYVATLQDRVKREHPDHTSEVLAVNEFRKVPR